MFTFQPRKVLAICSDLFGTQFDFSNVPYEERKAYADHIKKPNWSRFVPPESWLSLKPFPDVVEGIREIRKHVKFYTLSNAPWDFTYRLLNINKIEVDGVVDLAEYRIFKPNRRAYIEACQHIQFRPEYCLMLTANRDFGDLQGARSIGMQAQLLRGKAVRDMLELAKIFAELPVGHPVEE